MKESEVTFNNEIFNTTAVLHGTEAACGLRLYQAKIDLCLAGAKIAHADAVRNIGNARAERDFTCSFLPE